MKVLVTGGAGFIGRWIVKKLLDKGFEVSVYDDLSNGKIENLAEFGIKPIIGDIRDRKKVLEVFNEGFDLCIHAAAQINVQESLDNPEKSVTVNIDGTFNVLEAARKHNTKVTLMGTCMVYDLANTSKPIGENHPVKPASPYAASKLAAEELALSYYYGYKLPVVILRPFNTYGPYQKSNMEGGVISIFIKKNLAGDDLLVYGDGMQTRDLLYVEDCADFIIKAVLSNDAVGQIINAGLGRDISVNDLADLICKDRKRIKHVPHHHPQSEIEKLVCDYSKAKALLSWEPKNSLEEGVRKTEKWIAENYK
jgi:UDP-glucose 4-epimerase